MTSFHQYWRALFRCPRAASLAPFSGEWGTELSLD